MYIHSPRPLSFSTLHVSLRGKNLPGVPSRDLNSGLPYSRPAHYQLSHAATLANIYPSQLESHQVLKFGGPYCECASTKIISSVDKEGLCWKQHGFSLWVQRPWNQCPFLKRPGIPGSYTTPPPPFRLNAGSYMQDFISTSYRRVKKNQRTWHGLK